MKKLTKKLSILNAYIDFSISKVSNFRANIKDIYYGCTKEDAGKIGFRDDLIYEYLEGKNNNLLNKIELDRNECLQVFNEYDEENRTIY